MEGKYDYMRPGTLYYVFKYPGKRTCEILLPCLFKYHSTLYCESCKRNHELNSSLYEKISFLCKEREYINKQCICLFSR